MPGTPLIATRDRTLSVRTRIENLSTRQFPASASYGRRLVRLGAQLCSADGQLIGFGASVTPPTPPPPTTTVHDLAITGITIPAVVSRSGNQDVFVTLVNRGTTTEAYHIFFGVDPGGLFNDYVDTIGPGQTKPIGVIWHPSEMGGLGSKAFFAHVVIQGATDTNPTDNTFSQPVTVGP